MAMVAMLTTQRDSFELGCWFMILRSKATITMPVMTIGASTPLRTALHTNALIELMPVKTSAAANNVESAVPS